MSDGKKNVRMIVESVRKEAQEKKEKIEAIEKQIRDFWSRVGDPLLKRLVNEFDAISGLQASVLYQETKRTLMIIDRSQYNERRYNICLNAERKDISAVLNFADDYIGELPLRGLNENMIENAILIIFEKVLKKSIIPE